MISEKECIIQREKVRDISDIISCMLRFENEAAFYFDEDLVRYIAEYEATFAQWTNDAGKKTYSVRCINSKIVIHIQFVLVYNKIFQTECYKMVSTSIKPKSGITKLIRNNVEADNYFLLEL